MLQNFDIGTWAEIPSTYSTHIMSKAGFDFSIIDFEHGVIDFETAQNMIFTAHSLGKKIYIRVPSIEESWTLRSLDMAPDGIIFPQVTNTRKLEKIKELCYFYPMGKRGFNPYIVAGGYTSRSNDYFESSNNNIQVGVIIEDINVFQNLDEFLSFDGIDIFYIGQYDLSVSMGLQGDVNNPRLLSVMDNAVKKIRAANKKAGCMVHSVAEARTAIKNGFNFIVYKVDSGILYNAVKTFVDGVYQNEIV